MQSLQSRLVTLCQQLLALGVVLAVLTPASGVVSLDIVGERPDRTPAGTRGGTPTPAHLVAATVPTGTVVPSVTEVPLTSPTGHIRALSGRTVVGGSVAGARRTPSRVTSTPQPIEGLAAVGVTWQSGEELTEDQISLQVRTRTADRWSGWEALEYHDEHGPDAGSTEAAQARPGTDPVFVGDVDDVQVRADTRGTTLPDDLSLSLVDPGVASQVEKVTEEAPPADGITLQAARKRKATQPTIFSRAQWGADERIRNKKSLRYGSISAGFVHHTVNANDYTEDQVPAILRSIYAYHVKSRGWSDIGYNFLVDRFGRIWEGRYGGIDKPVVGAHTLNYNDYSFAMSAIGNFETVQPPDVMLRAYGDLFAWKFSLHGVNPASTSQKVGRGTFQAISGHRDAGSTACPGKYLYAKLPLIRQYATTAAPPAPPAPPAPTAPAPVTVGTPSPQGNLVGAPYPDLVVRRASDGRAMILPTGGLTAFGPRTVTGKKGWKKRADVLVSPDLTGDGVADLVTVDKSGVVRIRAGRGNGRFGKTTKKLRLKGYSMLTAVGDINGDGRNDLVARHKGRLKALLGTRKGGFARKSLDKGFGNYVQLIGAGDVDGDGRPDLLARTKGRLHLYSGKGDGTFAGRRRLGGSWTGYVRMVGGDFNGDGRVDLVAKARNGRVFMFPGRGDTTFGARLGPVANLKAMRHLTAGGQLVGGPGGDLVGVAGDRLVVVANKDTFELGEPVDAGVSFSGMNLILNVGDLNRDGAGDVVARDGQGQLLFFAGNGQGQLAAGVVIGGGWGAINGLTAVGDVTGDGNPDLIGTPAGGRLTIWRGNGAGGFSASAPVASRVRARAGLPTDLSRFDWVLGVQSLRLKGTGDFVVRKAATGRLYLYTGRTSGVSRPRVLGEGLGVFDLAG